MDRQAIFLSNEKIQDLEGYPNDAKVGSSPSIPTPSAEFVQAEKPSPVKLFVRWALIGSLIVLAMTFTSGLLEPRGSKASQLIHQKRYACGSQTTLTESYRTS